MWPVGQILDPVGINYNTMDRKKSHHVNDVAKSRHPRGKVVDNDEVLTDEESMNEVEDCEYDTENSMGGKDAISWAQEMNVIVNSQNKDEGGWATVGPRRNSKRSRADVDKSSGSEIESSYVFKKVNHPEGGLGLNNPKVVILSCKELNLARLSPFKIAKALQEVGTDMVKKVNKVRSGIAVNCYTAAQAAKLVKINKLGEWQVSAEFPKSETRSRGVVSGIPVDVSEEEILEACKDKGVSAVKRLNRKVEGAWVESSPKLSIPDSV